MANRTARRSVVGTPFEVLEHADRDVVRLFPVGEVDFRTAGRIREHIEKWATAGVRVVLDLRGTTFLDSAGLHLVLDADAASREDGWEFGLIHGPPRVQRVFDLTGARAKLPFLTAAQLSALLAGAGDPTA